MTPARIRRAATTVAAVILLLLATTTPAGAGPDDHAKDLEAYLAAHPGGTKINDREISYGGGKFIVTVTRSVGVLAGPDCPSNWFCFYDGLNYGYPRGRLSDCGWQDLAGWGWQDRTESVHYNMTRGSVWFQNHLSGGHGNDVNLFNVGVSLRTRSDVSPYRNMADHVNRSC